MVANFCFGFTVSPPQKIGESLMIIKIESDSKSEVWGNEDKIQEIT